MSQNASATVFFGLCFGAEDRGGDAGKFAFGETDPAKTETQPAALAYWGHAKDGVQVVGYGHHEYRRWALAVEGTVSRTRSWDAMPLPELPAVVPDFGPLKTYCERHGLTWAEPRWYVVADYS